MTTTTPKYMAVQGAALLVAAGFIVLGVLGLIPVTTPGDKLFGVFAISGLHNLLHLLSGFVGIALARTYAASRAYFLGGGLVYLVLWLHGLFVGARLLPINGADNWLHFCLGLVMVLLGLTLAGQRDPTKRLARQRDAAERRGRQGDAAERRARQADTARRRTRQGDTARRRTKADRRRTRPSGARKQRSQ
jgi:hypothetical protein